MTTTPPRRRRRPASTRRIIFARVRARGGLIAGIGAAIALSMGLVCGLFATAHLETAAAIRAAMPDPEDASGWLQLQTRPAADSASQDAAAEELFTELVGDAASVERLELGEAGSDLERVAWRITPNPETLGPDSVATLAAGLAELPDAFRESDAAEGGSLASGGLPLAMQVVAQGVRAAAALAPVPLAILAVLAWFAVLQLARLLGLSRGREAVLLRARGLSPGQAVPLAAGESVAVTIAGALVGLAAAAAWLASAWGSAGLAALTSAWPVALCGVVVLAATLTAGQLRAARAAEGSASAAGRIARAASPGAAVLLVLIAAVLVWQSRSSGPAEGVWTIALAALAPTIALAAVAVLAVLLFGPLSAAVARVAERSPLVAPAYPARQVARRVASFSVAVALVTIAVSGAALAGSYAATWFATSTSSAELQAGAPLRADVDPVTPEAMAAAASTPGVASPVPVVATAITAGDVAGALVALADSSMAEVLFDVPGAADPASLAETLAIDSHAVAFPAGATGLRVEARVSATDPDAAAATRVSAWMMADSGLPVLVTLDVTVATDDDGVQVMTAVGELPTATEQWSLAAVEFARTPVQSGTDLLFTEIEIDAVAGDEIVPLDVRPAGELRLTFFRTTGGTTIPGVPSALVWSAGGRDPAALPVAVTASFAQQLGLEVGDPVDVRFDGTGRTLTVELRAIHDALPGLGAGPGVLGPLAGLVENQLPSQVVSGDPAATPPLPDELWAVGDDEAAASLARALETTVSTPADPAATVTRWVVATWNTAAVGGALLAGVALAALLTALTSQRAGEVLVLRALGIASRQQSRMRAVETGLVVVLASVLGVIGGMLLAALLVPSLVERAVPAAQLAPTPALDPWPLVITALVVAAAWAGSALGAALAVRLQAASTRLEEAAA